MASVNERGGRPEAGERTDNPFFGKDILSVKQFTPENLAWLFQFVPLMEEIHMNAMDCRLLVGKVMIPVFFEPSSRTRLSHQTAMLQLGGRVNSVEDPSTYSSFAKGANFKDEITTYGLMGDLMVIRHPKVGSAQEAAAYAGVPVINAGDGPGEHPTQALLDVATIWKKFGRLDNLTVVFGGDLLNGRTIRSLAKLLANFEGNRFICISPEELALPRELAEELGNAGVGISEYDNFTSAMQDADIWYWTRIQKERFASRAMAELLSSLDSAGYVGTDLWTDEANQLAQKLAEESYGRVKNWGVITPEVLDSFAAQDMILMHPFPRVKEITFDVDSDSRAVYLREQMLNGIFVRMALLASILRSSLTPRELWASTDGHPLQAPFIDKPQPNLGKTA